VNGPLPSPVSTEPNSFGWHASPSSRRPRSIPIWSPFRWSLVIGVLFLTQAFLLVRFSKWPSSPVPPAPNRLRLELPLSSTFSPNFADEFPGADPTYLALPGRDAFSRTSERALPKAEYKPTEYQEAAVWMKATREIHLPQIPAPETPHLPVPPIRLNGERTADRLMPGASWVETRMPGRKLAHPIVPPTWTTTDVLRPTVVEVSVTAFGEVISARLVDSNGLAVADESALELARRARFEALPSGPALATDRGDVVGWEWLIFHWHTRSPVP
jgi:TonB family protein